MEKSPETPVFKKQCYLFLKSYKGKAAYCVHLLELWLHAGIKYFQKSPMCKECLKHIFLGYIFNFLYIALNLLLRFRGGKITTNKENSWLFLIAETWFINGCEFSEDRRHKFKNKA